ncbi:MAG: NADH-quinone oxidoreductase subunit A [Dehalococcoidales bacterium]|nr:NADH-quinone oxidoreductase subunit A [Dehalococcoidales bacterium]
MLQSYGNIALFLIVSISFSTLLVLLPVVLRLFKIVTKKPNPIKYTPFECGMETIGTSWVQFNFRYYFFALMLIALDMMIVFLYPWAVELKNLGATGLWGAFSFVFIIFTGYIYAWKKGMLEWK